MEQLDGSPWLALSAHVVNLCLVELIAMSAFAVYERFCKFGVVLRRAILAAA
jgi:hypothetical protein